VVYALFIVAYGVSLGIIAVSLVVIGYVVWLFLTGSV
jgi:hypothetical protein